jgi:beta-glucosidase
MMDVRSPAPHSVRLALFASSVASALACSPTTAQPSAAPAAAAAAQPSPHAAPPPDPHALRDVEQLIAQMTLAEKIGQMTQADRQFLKSEDEIQTLALGSVLNGGDQLPKPNDPKTWADMYDHYQSLAMRTRLGIPLLYGVDAVHGHNGVRGAVIFPHNIGLGASRDPDLVERAARVTALEVAGTGIDWTFAPCIAVPRDERWGRTYEGFGETAELATLMAPSAVKGLEMGPAPVLACAKHFLGDGATAGGKNEGDARISEEELRAVHLPGYAAAVRAGVGSIMVSYSSWNGAPMHGSRHYITDVLKGELGFSGFVVSDWEGIDKMPGDFEHDVETAINAGIDMAMLPNHYREFIPTLTRLVESKRVPIIRVDDAVRRILRAKAKLGLWDRPFTDRTLTAQIGSAEHRRVAREAVEKSLVLLKNEKHLLPLPKTARILVAGAKADDIGAQCGGWAVGWNGSRGPITPGTSILTGLREVAPGARITYAPDGKSAEPADVGIVVVGEEPYAESKGDRADLHLDAGELSVVEAMKKKGRPLIVVLLSGRPMILGGVLDAATALVAAWLPGTEGAGIGDVLFGDASPAGKLPHSWPRAMEQIPINQGDAKYDPLFAYGFGLGYSPH